MNEYLPAGIEKLKRGLFLERGELAVIAGPPRFGKTSLACRMIHNLGIENKYKIGVFSQEMSADSFAKWVLHKRSEVKKDHDYVKVLSEASEKRIWIDDIPFMTARAMEKKSLEMKKLLGGLDYVFIDYFQLISAEKKYKHHLEEANVISRSLKEMARKMDCVVIVISQLSRKTEMKPELRPNQSHRPWWQELREVGLEMDTDVAIFLYRDEMPFPDLSDQGKVELKIEKYRNGPAGESVLLDLKEDLFV